MSRSLLSALVLAALMPGCAPSVRVPVLQPAMVTLPAQVRTIGVVDRSGPKNVGEHILGLHDDYGLDTHLANKVLGMFQGGLEVGFQRMPDIPVK